MSYLRACYDLSVCPPTYDVVSWLTKVELDRVSLGYEFVDVYIFPGPAGGFRVDTVWPRSIPERVKLREQVLVPMCYLLPSVRNVIVCKHHQAHVTYGVGKRWISLQFYAGLLAQGLRPLRILTGPKDPKLITITLREAEHHPKRNSNVDEWVKTAHYLQRIGYRVVIIRDTHRAVIPLPGLETSPRASLQLFERASLYSRALLNLGVNNGPMWMAIAMNAPVLMLKPTTEMGGCYNAAFFEKCGIPRGSNLPGSPSHQRMIWEEDIADVILREVDAIMPCLNG